MSSLRRRTVSAPHQTHWDHIFSLTVVTAGAWGWVSSFQEGDAGPPCAQLQPVSPTVQLSNYVCVCVCVSGEVIGKCVRGLLWGSETRLETSVNDIWKGERKNP